MPYEKPARLPEAGALRALTDYEALGLYDRDDKGRFLTGNSGGGRPTGARNKLSEDFLQTLAADFEAHGGAVIKRVREEYPHHYLRVVAALMTKQIDAKIDNRTMSELTDRELLELIVLGDGDISSTQREKFRAMLPATCSDFIIGK